VEVQRIDMNKIADDSSVDMLVSLVSNALIHLYLSISDSKGYTTLAKRNDILSRYLKSFVANPTYKGVKKDIKLLLIVAKKGNLEQKLKELNERCVAVDSGSDLNRILSLFTLIRKTDFWHVEVIDGSAGEGKPNVLYVLRDHLNYCFDDSGAQTAPLSGFIQTGQIDLLLPFITDLGLVSVSMKQSNVELGQHHLLLEPLNALQVSQAV
jgi:hypothetical protein